MRTSARRTICKYDYLVVIVLVGFQKRDISNIATYHKSSTKRFAHYQIYIEQLNGLVSAFKVGGVKCKLIYIKILLKFCHWCILTYDFGILACSQPEL